MPKKSMLQDTDYYHQVIDCQWACPAHTPVPQYIRLIAEGKYTEAYLLNRDSNVFPGILGRVCDRPCEPACRRSRVEKEPVAICRLKRASADFKGDIAPFLPKIPKKKNDKIIALIGAGPACLTVANDLLPLGYQVEIFEREKNAGGAMRSQVPSFRLPRKVLDEEINTILDFGATVHYSAEVTSLKELLNRKKYSAVVIGTGAQIGKDLDLPGRKSAASWCHIAFNWLASVAFGHVKTVGKRVIVVGGGNTAMDCARTAKRLGATEVTIVAPERDIEMTASPWEIHDATKEGIIIKNLLLPQSFATQKNKTGLYFRELLSCYHQKRWDPQFAKAEPVFLPCDEVILAVGQRSNYGFIDEGSGVSFASNGLPVLGPHRFQSSNPKIFFAGDAALGPKNIISAVADGHEVALSIDLFLKGKSPSERPQAKLTMRSEVLGYLQLSYRSDYVEKDRQPVPEVPLDERFDCRDTEVEKGFTTKLAQEEAQRCLNCDVQTVFSHNACISCDACVDICPEACLSITPNQSHDNLQGLKAPLLSEDQILFIGEINKGRQLMIKDEDLCVHCGACAQRCPTGAWDMQLSRIDVAKAGCHE